MSTTKHDASLAAGSPVMTLRRKTNTCPHFVDGCRKCVVTPLVNEQGEHISYFLEHRARKGRCIKCTVGFCNLPTPSGLLTPDIESGGLCAKITSSPESGTVSSDPSPIREIDWNNLQTLHNPPRADDDSELDLDYYKSTIGSQLQEVKEKMTATFPQSLIRKSSKALSQLVLLCVGLCHDTSFESVVTRCIAFLDAMLDDGIVMSLHDVLISYIKGAELPNELEGKTMQECFDLENNATQPEAINTSALAVWDTLKRGIFTKHLSYVVGTAFAFFTCKIQDIEFSHPLHDSIMKHAQNEKIDGVDFIDHVLKLYNWISTVGVACFEQRSLSPLTLNSGALAKCHEEYYKVKQWYIDAKRDGNSTMEERQEQFVIIETVHTTLLTLSKVERDKFTTLQSSSLAREVSSLYNDIKDFVCKIDAVKVPFAVHLHGTPKAGKSYIAPAIHEQVCMARGVPYRPSNNAQLNLMSEFQDEIDNSTQTITINETSAIKEQYAKSIETAYTVALALVDPVPHHPNRSNLEDKAKITAQHVSVASTGNKEEPFEHIAKTKGAWTRRYVSVHMKVAEQYSDDDGRFDSSKADGSNNYHLFDVYEIIYDESDHKKRKYFKYKGGDSRGLNTRDFMELIRALAIAHFKEEDRLEFERKTAKKAGCLVCQRLAHFCICEKSDVPPPIEDVTRVAASVISGIPMEDRCPKCTTLGPHGNTCVYEADNECCVKCGNVSATPESGALVQTALSFGSSLVWETVTPWFNPFIRMQWLWSIDRATTESLREELLEEIAFIPDTIGVQCLSLLPERWLTRKNGTKTFLGKRKDDFLRFVAAEKQMILPVRVLLKRAFTISFLVFICATLMIFMLDWFGFQRHTWEFTQKYSYEVTKWGWIPLFPEYSGHVMDNREYYATRGIYTLAHLRWKDFYVNLNLIQRLLGQLWYFGFYQETVHTHILVRKLAEWWHFPLIMSTSYFILSFCWMWMRKALGFQRRYHDLQVRASSDKDLQKNLYDKIKRCPQEYNSLVPTAVGMMGVIISGLTLWNMIRSKPESSIDRTGKKEATPWNSFMLFKRQTPKSGIDNSVSHADTVSRVKKACCLVKATVGGKDTEVIGVWIRTGLLLLPRHFFKPNPYHR